MQTRSNDARLLQKLLQIFLNNIIFINVMNISLIAWLIVRMFFWSFQFFCSSSLIELIFIESRNVCNVNCNTCARHDTCTIFRFFSLSLISSSFSSSFSKVTFTQLVMMFRFLTRIKKKMILFEALSIVIIKIQAWMLCLVKIFSITFVKISFVCFSFIYSNSINTSWYFQFLSMKKTITDKYDWRFETDQQFKVRDILTSSERFLNKFASTSSRRFIMWFLMINAEKNLIYESKHWNIRKVFMWSLIVKFWSIAITQRRNWFEKSFRVKFEADLFVWCC